MANLFIFVCPSRLGVTKLNCSSVWRSCDSNMSPMVWIEIYGYLISTNATISPKQSKLISTYSSVLECNKNNIQRRKREKLPDGLEKIEPNKDSTNDKTAKPSTNDEPQPPLSGQNQHVAALRQTDTQPTQGIYPTRSIYLPQRIYPPHAYLQIAHVSNNGRAL